MIDFCALLFVDAPEITVEKNTVHTGEGSNAQLVCIIHGEPQPQVGSLINYSVSPCFFFPGVTLSALFLLFLFRSYLIQLKLYSNYTRIHKIKHIEIWNPC